MVKEAMYYKKLENGDLICELCPHKCSLSEGRAGVCGVRKNKGSRLETTNYARVSSMGFDPIEKKPLYHYKPGTQILSVGSFGCNFDCGFCQNYSISKHSPETAELSAEELTKKAIELTTEGNVGIAFTYNEPTIWYEFVREGAEAAKNAGLDVVLVTNGYINQEPLDDLLHYVDAANIDLKAFSNEFYRKICNGDVESVKRTIELANSKCHVEIATLLIEGYNNSEEEIHQLTKWIKSINVDIPLHLSKYHPAYKFKEPPTTNQSMQRSLEIAKQNLRYVYLGNVWDCNHNTYCYNCDFELVGRNDIDVRIAMKTSNCPKCGVKINIVL